MCSPCITWNISLNQSSDDSTNINGDCCVPFSLMFFSLSLSLPFFIHIDFISLSSLFPCFHFVRIFVSIWRWTKYHECSALHHRLEFYLNIAKMKIICCEVFQLSRNDAFSFAHSFQLFFLFPHIRIYYFNYIQNCFYYKIQLWSLSFRFSFSLSSSKHSCCVLSFCQFLTATKINVLFYWNCYLLLAPLSLHI